MSQKTHKTVSRVYAQGHVEFPPNTAINAEDIGGQETLDRLVAQGHVCSIMTDVSNIIPKMAALDVDHTGDDDAAKQPLQSEAAQASQVKSELTQAIETKKSNPRGLWECDPDALKGLSIENLNVMVGERDESIGQFETVEEAIAQLSADFKGEAAPQ